MPLLQEGQDPEGLAARVSYHLHRLGITSLHLSQSGMDRDMARRLREGSQSLSAADINFLAQALQLETEDLSRPLSDDEKAEWAFYRASARQVTAVWRRVAETCTAHSISQNQLSQMLAISQSAISRAMGGQRRSPVLTWDHAIRIAEVLKLAEGAEAFLPRENERLPDEERGR